MLHCHKDFSALTARLVINKTAVAVRRQRGNFMTQISTYLKHTLPETLLFVLSVCLLSLSNVTALTYWAVKWAQAVLKTNSSLL